MTQYQRIAQWWPFIHDAARHFDVDPYTLGAVMDVETEGCESRLLDVTGPAGTGDRMPRKGRHYENSPRYVKVGADREENVLWMPADGRGWGRGAMQIDYEFHSEWVDAKDAEDGFPLWSHIGPNVMKGAEILAGGFLAFHGDELPAIASYNCGIGRAYREMKELTQPITHASKLAAMNRATFTGHYVSSVLASRASFLAEDHSRPKGGTT